MRGTSRQWALHSCLVTFVCRTHGFRDRNRVADIAPPPDISVGRVSEQPVSVRRNEQWPARLATGCGMFGTTSFSRCSSACAVRPCRSGGRARPAITSPQWTKLSTRTRLSRARRAFLNLSTFLITYRMAAERRTRGTSRRSPGAPSEGSACNAPRLYTQNAA